MVTASIELNTEVRTRMGKKTRALRRDGLMPLHLYGLDGDPLALQAPYVDVVNTVRAAGRTKLVGINVKGAKGPEICLVRSLDIHPVSSQVLHVDFMRVGEEKAVELDVPVELIKTRSSPLTRGSTVNITLVLPKVRVAARASTIPSSLKADCSKLLKITDTIKVGDLDVPSEVRVISDPKLRVVSVQLTRAARAAGK